MVKQNPDFLSSQLLDLAERLQSEGKLSDAEDVRSAAKIVLRNPEVDLIEGLRHIKHAAGTD
jgi:hypothetical protein